jgi:DNA-binding transcriptional MerR regulator
MRTGEAAKILGIDRTTIYNWVAVPLLTKFFSPAARGEDGATQRILTESDVLVLNTIRAQRTSGNADWEEIAVMLESGYREQEFPQNAISADPRTIPLPQAEVSAKAMATVAERDAALARVDELLERVHDLEGRLEEAEREKDEIKETLLREIGDMQRQIGKLEGQLEMYRDMIQRPRKDA